MLERTTSHLKDSKQLENFSGIDVENKAHEPGEFIDLLSTFLLVSCHILVQYEDCCMSGDHEDMPYNSA